MNAVPQSHPRYLSLVTREKIAKAQRDGIVHETGLIAHGRGEAFDYILGEKTPDISYHAEKTAAAALLTARNPVISINGNVAALTADECIQLANIIPAKLEINLFHRTNKRLQAIADLLTTKGATKIYGLQGNAQIPGIEHNRSYCDTNGIYSADVVLVPLEDGDRCHALTAMGKTVIAIDLNPLSRTAQTATITIVDNIIRAIPNLIKWCTKLIHSDQKILQTITNQWNNKDNLNNILQFMSKRLNSLF